MSIEPSPTSLQTQLLHENRAVPPFHPLVAPLYQTTTYQQFDISDAAVHTYSRCSNPSVTALERALATLESLPNATAYCTGMAAISTLAFSLLKSGDHVILGRSVYGGTIRLFQKLLLHLGVSSKVVDTTDLASLKFALEEQPARLVFIETPGNPTLCVTDIEAAADLAHAKGSLLAVDNTFLTGALQRPGDLGADFVVLSTTKFIEGHNTSLGGAILHRDPAYEERLLFVRKTLGNIQTPFQAWLTLNGMRTLPLRLAAHSRNAELVAAFLQGHPSIERVLYPGLRNSKGYEIACRQQSAFGGVVSFVLKGGLGRARTFLQSLKLVTLAENLGCLETLITHPATMTHRDLTELDRSTLGLSDGFLRLSVGIEGTNDILRDLEQSLAKTYTGGEACLS